MSINNEFENDNPEFDLEQIEVDDFFKEPTPEEIEQRKIERAKELAEKGFLPENEEYSETMTSPQEIVENNPTRFIIQECIPACQELWKRNIYTFMVSDHLNEGQCWVEMIADGLSDENKAIYLSLSDDEVIKFSYHQGCINFGVNAVGKDGQIRLLEIAQKFQMQDVPQNQAYLSKEDFLMGHCGCYTEYDNPNYKPMTAPWMLGLSLDKLGDYMIKYDDWQASEESKETLKKFAPEKATKSVEEYAKEKGMIADGDRVYLSQFHYNKHKNYINYVNSISPQSMGNGPKRH